MLNTPGFMYALGYFMRHVIVHGEGGTLQEV